MARRDKRIHNDPIVRRIARILDSGRPTRFAFEGACRHGIRAHLCLSGATWARADTFAALVVTLALHRIGATRPTWAQAQPEYGDDVERWWCVVCHGELNGERSKYCSDVCRVIGVNRDVSARRVLDEQAARAAMVAAGGRTLERACQQCGEAFEVDLHRPLRKFCSVKCFRESRAAQAKTCPQCGHQFTPRHNRSQKFCSLECRDESYRRPRGLDAAA